MAMCLSTGMVRINYIVIYKHYPDGGVYASTRHRSGSIPIIGAFFAHRGLRRHRRDFRLPIRKHTSALAVVLSVMTAAVVLPFGLPRCRASASDFAMSIL